jgi:hypothetical protein
MPHINALRALAIAAMGDTSLKWRQHGIGVVQAYLNDFTRLHVWHNGARQVAPGRMIHDHRFALESTVLLGRICNEVFYPTLRGDGTFRMYEVKHASLGERDLPTLLPGIWSATTEIETISVGQTYWMPKRLFHRTIADDYTVTLVHKTNQEECSARIFVPAVTGQPPYGFQEPTSGFCERLVADAVALLKKDVAK